MTGTASPIEWYLARDGQQHGPLSESEMRAFVDMGHLREQDLVWRPGFPDWRPAPEIFAMLKPQAQPAMPDAAPAKPAAEPKRTPDGPQASGAARTEAAPTQGRPESGAGAAQRSMTPTAATHGTAPAPYGSEPAPQAALISPDQLSRPAAPVFDTRTGREHATVDRVGAASRASAHPARADAGMANAGSSAPGQRPAAAGERAAPQQQLQERNFQTQQRKAHPNQAAGTAVAKPQPAQSQARGFADDEPAPKRRLSAGRIASVLVLAILTGAGIAAAVKRDQVAELLANLVPAASKSDPSLAAAPFTTAGTSSIDSIDGTFQRTAIWRHIKVEFPEWYAERVNEAAKLTAEKRGDTVIAKHLAEAVVSLRRKHADQALTASPERLRFVASAFLDNLQALAKQNVETCYGFISQGETYPAVLEMLQKQGANEPLQKQVIAVFEAISDGRKSPQSYLPPRKSDYDALAAELTARGWSQADLQTFSDPRALGRASPQQVCKMVQDWFAAQIAIKDPAAQLRLLVESLRPVVAG